MAEAAHPLVQHDTSEAWLIADYIRGELFRFHHKQKDVAPKLGISRATLTRQLAGSPPFDVYELSVLARLLGTTLPELVEAATRSRWSASVVANPANQQLSMALDFGQFTSPALVLDGWADDVIDLVAMEAVGA